MILKTDGIVLKSFDFRETSRIATFFTRDAGKLKGILKGIRKDPRKFGSQIDRFSLNEILYYPTRHSEIHLVGHCDLKENFSLIRKDYQRSIAANYILELVDTIMPVEEKNFDVYQLMLDYLETLKEASDVDKLIFIFQIKTLLYSGFRPHIDSCVRCGKKVQGRSRFSLKSGGLICPACPTTETSFTVISPGTIASMLHIEESPWDKALRLGLTSLVKKELKYLLNHFLVYHLEKRLKTTQYLETAAAG